MKKIFTVINMKELGVETFTVKQDVANFLKIHRNTIKFKDRMFFVGYYCIIENNLNVNKKLNRK